MKKVYVPGSKSITNRALLLAALGDKSVVLHNVLDSDDSRYMQAALKQLGVKIQVMGKNQLKVTPPVCLSGLPSSDSSESKTSNSKNSPLPTPHSELFIGNAGTAARFLSAASLAVQGSYTLKGVDRMHERPQEDLIKALRSLGVEIECLETEGFLPARFLSEHRNIGTSEHRKVELSGKISSQFLSGIMLVAPALKDGLEIQITDSIPSRPYVEMTVKMLEIWGARVAVSGDFLNFKISPGFNAPSEYHIPSDMSSASYPLAWSVLRGAPICIQNFGTDTLQGDEQFVEVIKATGAKVTRRGAKLLLEPEFELKPIGDWNWETMPDVSMTGMVLAAFCPGVSKFTGLESLRVKECDRILAMEQLRLLGVEFKVDGDVVTIEGDLKLQAIDNKPIQNPKSKIQNLTIINSYDDHRIAMCFALAKAAIDLGADPHQQSLIKITEPECVGKTWPGFWLALADWENQLRPVSAIILKRTPRPAGTPLEPRGEGAEYLIVKKPRKHHAWQFPQGGVDAGETGRQAAVRELGEECGSSLNVKLKGERPIGEYAYFFPKDFDRHDPDIVGAKVSFFLADYVSGEVEVDGEEIIDHAWFQASELDQYFAGEYLQVVQSFIE